MQTTLGSCSRAASAPRATQMRSADTHARRSRYAKICCIRRFESKDIFISRPGTWQRNADGVDRQRESAAGFGTFIHTTWKSVEGGTDQGGHPVRPEHQRTERQRTAYIERRAAADSLELEVDGACRNMRIDTQTTNKHSHTAHAHCARSTDVRDFPFIAPQLYVLRNPAPYAPHDG